MRDETTESDASLAHRLSQTCNAHGFSASVRPIVHRLAYVNESLSEGRYFFLDIKREGRVLYKKSWVELEEPRELSAEGQRRIAQEYFDSWLKAAHGFYEGFEFYKGRDNLPLAAFNLNQSAESAYKCILLVHTFYTPQEHRLVYLALEAAAFGPVYEEIFPCQTQEEQDLFDLLDNAYIAGRYRMGFSVDHEHLDYLAERVQRLLAVTEQICQAEIERLAQDAAKQ
ncbi:hypothetical protein CAI21_22040 [Alkalilimnicola ehrlichii]|uniref:HEPN domain-containing protein n=1 Tax=Alkalilimnicola ehrlichii TaxID=351052 RepID=A0A3E0WF34_9GAMM|nr:hypothetical protein CAI21_22040 [Alkalilimnicola ehrlichii]RFA31560.1 hypothetical protein CAL65_22215 [Alkalilimnicola ehrlichii]